MAKPRLIDTSHWIQLPGFALVQPALERITGIDGINEIYRRVRRDGMGPAEFCAGALADLRLQVAFECRETPPPGTPAIILANHPTGMIESLMLILLLDSLRPGAWRLLSNRFVASTPEFGSHAIPLDPFGVDPDPHLNLRGLGTAVRWLKGGGCLGAFPAGRVAPRNGSGGLPRDAPWTPHLVRLARLSGARIFLASIPLASGALLRALPPSLPKLRALFLARETLRRRSETRTLVRLTEAPDLSHLPAAEATLKLHALCHENL